MSGKSNATDLMDQSRPKGFWEVFIVYALQIGDSIWVLHAFQKKSKSGRETPKPDINLIKERIVRLKEALK